MAADDITLGLFVSKAAKHSSNSYCKEGFYYEIAAQVATESVNSDPELLGDRKLVLDVRDIKKDRYETLKATNEIIMDHLESNATSPLAALIGTSDE
ncbi:hypothetical protein JH06_0095 [Blastocystis sp. subtype 4]|uniref:hypothetical protein n=1 Tax=Blastocystis sp. subtype 4 TaxID=944170 RepID=UPI000711BA12|nr:hypothetical protein JH06_0095 [Blastocystis sp. subtype 4]KNB46563.1 hypothetical protein JH06_0095 [Blastocystis sp. subtype 4]|eukprot:XP_014530006.1 hypothetical protein JH06_0095 [Blastocystis sp. subtype 4]